MARSYPAPHLKEHKVPPPSPIAQQELTSPIFHIYKSQVPIASIPIHQHIIDKLNLKPNHASIQFGHEIKNQLQTTLMELESRAKNVRKALETLQLEESYRESEVLIVLIAKEKTSPAATVTKYFETEKTTESFESFQQEESQNTLSENDIDQALSYDIIERALAEAEILLEY